MVYKIPPLGGGEVNHIWPLAYQELFSTARNIKTIMHFLTHLSL